MRRVSQEQLEELWSRSDGEWRDPAQIASQWSGASDVDPRLLRYTVRGDWWETLASTGMTLLVTREYEHLLMAMRAGGKSRPDVSYLPLPHPSGLAVDDRRRVVHVASTRNPNQIFDLMPVVGLRNGLDAKTGRARERRLVPVRSRFLPGGLYLHDMAMIGGKLYANAVGENSIVRLLDDGRYQRVWWPRSVETNAGAFFEQNYLQLNSIAAGATIRASYFSASADRPSARRPGQKNFPGTGAASFFRGRRASPLCAG